MNDSNEQEVFAMLNAQRFIIELICANAFAADPAGWQRMMAEAVRLTRAAPSTAEPSERDSVIEQQARMATHLLRIEQNVLVRIASGRRV